MKVSRRPGPLTSAAADEGKTTTLANLAVTFAQAGARTLIVDCDLRRPALHTLFGVPNAAGFTSLVLEEGPTGSPIQPTIVDNLSILPSGPLPPNPADFLGSARVERTIQNLLHEADALFFDAGAPHGPEELLERPMTYLSIIIYPRS